MNNETLDAFATWRREQVAAATLNKDLASLLALWRFAHRLNLLPEWPLTQLEPEPQRIPFAWTEAELSAILQAARRLPGTIGNHQAADWWAALLLVCFDTAERIGAVRQLTWDRVDLHRRWIMFKAETRKGSRADSAVRIHHDTATSLARIRHSRGPVFPWPFVPNSIWSHYGKLLEAAGLPSDRRHKFHAIRRTTASHLEAAGGNATAALRHSSRAITQAYLDPRIAPPPQAVDLLFRPKT